jgi:uncharacterized membrane protein
MAASHPSVTLPSAVENINAICALEEKELSKRNWTDRMSDAIANFVGSIPFVIVHVVIFLIWVFVNLSGVWKFDPYPYALLCMIVSLEGVLLSTFVLIKQNRMSQRADQRAHLDLQINLLSEREITKILQLQRLICERLQIEEGVRDLEAAELSHVTAVDNIARELDEKLPKDI